jgi:DNA polymerase-1
MPPILFLIDGHALAYRTYYALTAGGSQRLTTSKGEPIAGVYGFASVLLRLLEQEHPEYLAVAFDTGKTFRNELFPDYKATRAKMPDDLRPQIEHIRRLIDAFGIPRLEVEGVEADDVLGSVAAQAVKHGLGVKIITGDRDLLQLVNARVIIHLAGNKLSEARDFTPETVVEVLGVRAEQVVDYKALVGDKSDNIPGVSGVGEKTAIELLQRYPTLDEIYAHLEEIAPRIRTRLETGREVAYLSRTLATIRTDVPLSLEIERTHTSHLNFSAAEAIFHELEFRTLIRRLQTVAAQFSDAAAMPMQQLSLFGEPLRRLGQPPRPDLHTRIVTSEEDLSALVQALNTAEWIALDTETTDTDPMRAALVGISLAISPDEGWYIPLGHQTLEATQLPLEQVLSALRPTLTNPQQPKLGQNLKYDCIVLAQHGLEVTPLGFDTMIAQWLINPDARLGLKDMAEDWLGMEMTHIETLIGKGKNQRKMSEVPIEEVAPYAAADAAVPLRLRPLLEERLNALQADRLLHEIEMPLVPVLVQMERTGICLDVPFLEQMSAELTQRLSQLEQAIYQAAGTSFNINSTQQLSEVLFNRLGLEPPDRKKRTASGHFSTSAEVLEELRRQHPVPDLLLEYRELAKLKSTYVDALPRQVNPHSGRVHTSYNQTGSVTGRLASSNPNLQNIPIRSEVGQQVRRAFIAAPGHQLLSVDYSQIELRLVAAMSEDAAMIAAFQAGQDIHAATAAAIYGIPLEQVSKEQRRHAKAINFGLIYGMSAFGRSRSTELTLGEAERFVKAYFERFPGVKEYLDGIRRLAARQGYVETLLGRRRYFPNLQSNANPALRAREEREAINAPIQGTAADLLKIAMIRLPTALQTAGLGARMLLQVHDELVLECKQDEIENTAAIVQDIMEKVYSLAVPLLSEARFGPNWGEMQPLKR